MTTEFEKPAIFISYPRADEQIANKLRESLVILAPGIDVLLDQEIIPPGDDFEADIYAAIKRSQWFAIICSGEPDSDKNFDWCYYEAGQFRSIMKSSILRNHDESEDSSDTKKIDEAVTKKLCVLYDKIIPRNLAKWNATKVVIKDEAGKELRIPTPEPPDFNSKYQAQIESSPAYTFFKNIVVDPNIPGGRNLADEVTKTLLRRQTIELVRAFQSSKIDPRLPEEVFSYRLTITIPPFDPLKGALQPDTEINGQAGALSRLFGIATNPTTWQAVIDASKMDNDISPYG